MLYLGIACRNTWEPIPVTTLPEPATTPSSTQPIPTRVAAQPSISPVPENERFPSPIRVQGNAYVDANGKPVIFRGVSPIDPVIHALEENPAYGSWSETHYREIANWGANIVRLPVHPQSLHNYGIEEVLRVLDQTVTWIGRNNMYVILDFHSIGWPQKDYYTETYYETNIQEILSFWDTISTRYAKNNIVAFYELFNEPVTQTMALDNLEDSEEDWLSWKVFLEEIISVIRKNDQEKIILASGLQWSYDLSYTTEYPMQSEQIGYVTHPYPSSDWRKSWDEAFGSLSATYPVFATEFGYDQDVYLEKEFNNIPYHLALLDYLEQRKMSWAVWCFDAEWTPALLEDIHTYTPTISGEYYRQRLLELNKTP